MPNDQSHDPRVATAGERVAAAVSLSVSAADGSGTPPPTPGDVFFEDDFSSGDLTKTETSGTELWSWAGGYSVDSSNAFQGSNSAAATYGPDALGEDSTKELRFDFGLELTEVWVEYYLFIPANFYHRSDPPSNNKFFQFNYNGSTYQALTIEFEPQAPAGTSAHKRFLAASENPDGSTNWPVSEPTIADFIGPDGNYFLQTASWNQIRIHFKSSTDGTTPDGLAELWANGSLVRSLSWPFWKVSTQGKINGGYIMGWANSGYENATEFRVDAFKCFVVDPGWT